MQDIVRASGLSPSKFEKSVDLIRNVVTLPTSTSRTRLPTRKAALTSQSTSLAQTKKPKLDKEALLDKAKAIQRGKFEPSSPFEPAATSSSMSFRAILPSPMEPMHRKIEPAESLPILPPPKPAPPPKVIKKTPVPAPLSKEQEQVHTRLLSVGIPKFREGIKFDVQPRRKRGRPPAERLTTQQIKDKMFLATLYSTRPEETPSQDASVPARYVRLSQLSSKEAHWMRPLPIPLVMPHVDPSAHQVSYQELWAARARQWHL